MKTEEKTVVQFLESFLEEVKTDDVEINNFSIEKVSDIEDRDFDYKEFKVSYIRNKK